ncbi:MAG: hypothetical protein AAF611_02545 [Bacteroidota bacterium]
MEKRYFVLKKGYLNITEDFFYFSDHGNWKTCEVLEETEMPVLTFFYVSNHFIKIFYTILAIVFAALLFTGKENFSGLVLLLGGVFHLIGMRYKLRYFKIPLQKIEKLELHDTKLTVTFLNRTNKTIKHTVKLDDQGEIKDIRQYLQAYFQPKLRVA